MEEKDNLEILSKKLKYKNNGMKQRIYNWSQDTLTNDNTNINKQKVIIMICFIENKNTINHEQWTKSDNYDMLH